MLNQAAPVRVLSWIGPLGAIAVVAVYFARGYRSGAAWWAMIAVLFAIQLLRDRIPFSVRKGLTTTVLVGLVALYVWGTVVWYREQRYAAAAATAYASLAWGATAVWAATVWKPATGSTSSVRFDRGAVVVWILAGYLLLFGFSQLSTGYLPIAVLVWATSALCITMGVLALWLHLRVRRQIEISKRLGFDDLHAYYEARRREGMSLEQMATETGLMPRELERATEVWKEFHRRKSEGI